MDQFQLELEFKALKEDLARVRSDLSELTGSLGCAGKESIEKGARRFVEDLQEIFQGVRNRGKKALDGAESKIEAHPLLSLLAVFGLGFLAGRFLERR